MKILHLRELALPEVKILTYARFPDERGYFTETFREADLREALGDPGFCVAQVNESLSRGGVFRGLHAQWNPFQGKLVRPLDGRLVDLALDIRKGSPTFGRIVACALEPAGNEGEWVWIPPGFAHGTYLPEDCRIEYLCTSPWSPGFELSISPLSESIDWSLCDTGLAEEVRVALTGDLSMSGKDRGGVLLSEWLAREESGHFTYSPGEPCAVIDPLGA